MINDEHVISPILCTLQFREPLEYEAYPDQYEYYIPKIYNQDLLVQLLVSEDVKNDNAMWITLYDEEDNQLLTKNFTITALNDEVFYANANITKAELQAIGNDKVGYFSVTTKSTEIATSIWYLINPTKIKTLKTISYSHGENDYSVVFSSSVFQISVECGVAPDDSIVEQETTDFVEQNMTNETVYGDMYGSLGMLFGSGIGIPNWLRDKIAMISVLDTVKYDGLQYVRVQGTKLEEKEKTKKGLAIHKLQVQKTINYIQ